MARAFRTLATALAAFAILFALGAHAASAHTYNKSLTIWFDDKTLDDGDVVKGDVNILFGDLTCNDGAVIAGDVRYYFGEFNRSDGCKVGGREIHAFDGDQNFMPVVPRVTVPDGLSENRKIFEKLGWDVVVVLIFLLFPLRVRVALERVERHPGLSAGAGTIAIVAVLPIAVMLALSIIGIPLIIIEFAALLAGIWIGHAAVALLVGRRLYELIRPHATPSPLGALLIGLVVVSAAQTLPVVGWAVTALVWIVGLGATVLAFMRESAFHGTIGGVPANPA
jgi:hypothetical protein